jgi:hypothetical protein
MAEGIEQRVGPATATSEAAEKLELFVTLPVAGASMRRLGVSTDFWFFFVRRFLFFAFGEAALLYGGFISDFYPHSGGVA